MQDTISLKTFLQCPFCTNSTLINSNLPIARSNFAFEPRNSRWRPIWRKVLGQFCYTKGWNARRCVDFRVFRVTENDEIHFEPIWYPEVQHSRWRPRVKVYTVLEKL